MLITGGQAQGSHQESVIFSSTLFMLHMPYPESVFLLGVNVQLIGRGIWVPDTVLRHCGNVGSGIQMLGVINVKGCVILSVF